MRHLLLQSYNNIFITAKYHPHNLNIAADVLFISSINKQNIKAITRNNRLLHSSFKKEKKIFCKKPVKFLDITPIIL